MAVNGPLLFFRYISQHIFQFFWKKNIFPLCVCFTRTLFGELRLGAIYLTFMLGVESVIANTGSG